MTCDDLTTVQIGWTSERVVALLGLTAAPAPYDGPAGGTWLDFSVPCGVMIFFGKTGVVRSLVCQAPFSGEIRGLRVGDGKSRVRDLLGAPHRRWPVQEGFLRWI